MHSLREMTCRFDGKLHRRSAAAAAHGHLRLQACSRRPHKTGTAFAASGPSTSTPTSPPFPAAKSGASSAIRYLPSLSRKTDDPLLPRGAKVTGLMQLGEGLWCLRQDFVLPNENIYVNCPIIQLSSGGLMLVNPPMATEEAVALVASVEEATGARVEHVVIPNLFPEHWYGAAEWAPHLAPEVRLWVVSGLLERRGIAGLPGAAERLQQVVAAFRNISELPAMGPLPGLEAEVESATFSDSLGLFTESALWFRSHRAVVLADMAFAAYDHQFNGGLLGPKLARIFQRLGCPASYFFLRTSPERARVWAERVLSWDVDRVLTSHLDPLVVNGAQELRRCFEFVLE